MCHLKSQKITVYDKDVIISKYANPAISLSALSDTGCYLSNASLSYIDCLIPSKKGGKRKILHKYTFPTSVLKKKTANSEMREKRPKFG